MKTQMDAFYANKLFSYVETIPLVGGQNTVVPYCVHF